MTTYALRGGGNSTMRDFTSNADVLVEGYNLGACYYATITSDEDGVRWWVPAGGWILVDGKKVKGPAAGIARKVGEEAT